MAVPSTGRLPKVILACLVAAVLVLASLLALYTIPLEQTRAAHVSWFHTTMINVGGPFPGGGAHVPIGFFCLPSNAVGDGFASFLWQSVDGTSVNLSFIALTPYPTYVYYVNTQPRGDFAFDPQQMTYNGGNLCTWPSEFSYLGAADVSVSLIFVYNYTTTVPIL